MAVLVEAISVIVRRNAIDSKYSGGWAAFVREVPNATLCTDEQIARVGFMAPADVEAFVDHLKHQGLQFMAAGKAMDFAVADQQHGLTTDCDWLEFARLNFGDAGGKVSACWLFEGPRIAAGIHLRGTSLELATPVGWNFEGSLSQKFRFVATGDTD